MKNKNIFISILDILDVNYTSEYANKLYDEHPFKHSLYGLSDMLSQYDVDSLGIRLEEKEKALSTIPVPFIAHINNDFIIVTEIKEKGVSYNWKNEKKRTLINDFNNIWTGEALLIESNENSSEPDYQTNLKVKTLRNLNKYSLLLLVMLLSIFLLLRQHLSFLQVLILLLYIIGGIVSFALVHEELSKSSKIAEKICSLLIPQSQCGSVLESRSSTILGVFHWSSIGLSYFLSGVISILVWPNLYGFAAFLNVLSLPYTFWSVWYQKEKAKQWCALCLIVQVLQWGLFVCNIIGGYLFIPTYTMDELFLLVLIWVTPFLVINSVVWYLEKNYQSRDISYKYNLLKSYDEVFIARLHSQEKHEVSTKNSHILLGKTGATNTITIVANPHCQPCALLHERIEKLLEKQNVRFQVQYIFVSPNETKSESSKLLISAYLKHPLKIREIYKEWFSMGKLNVTEFAQKYNCNPNAPEVLSEYNLHKEWKNANGIVATPTIFVNGYVLPPEYQIEDLRFFEMRE